MKTLFLGDIHGDWATLNDVFQRRLYREIPIIQIGDLGLGFSLKYDYFNHRTGLWETKIGSKDPEKFPDRFRFIRGNHDNPEACRRYPNYMGDYGVDSQTGIFYMSGAKSIDRDNRTIGIDWWDDEELSTFELQKAIDLYAQTKPKIVISHACPSTIAKMLSSWKEFHGSKTETALEMMWSNSKPKVWIFGHWHMAWRKNVLGTKFICCPINGRMILDLDKI